MLQKAVVKTLHIRTFQLWQTFSPD